MARNDIQHPLLPSVIDRLIDPDSGGTSARPGYSVEKMVAAVHRDLEDLLNTRRTDLGIPEAFVEVHHSIIGYGLPDLTSLNTATAQQREEIGRVLEQIVAHYEPRLKDVRATLLDHDESREFRVEFRVEARLCLDPAPEVAFDTILELTTGHYTITPARS
jgi:type VI secretion system protein ImpF